MRYASGDITFTEISLQLLLIIAHYNTFRHSLTYLRDKSDGVNFCSSLITLLHIVRGQRIMLLMLYLGVRIIN